MTPVETSDVEGMNKKAKNQKDCGIGGISSRVAQVEFLRPAEIWENSTAKLAKVNRKQAPVHVINANTYNLSTADRPEDMIQRKATDMDLDEQLAFKEIIEARAT